MDFIFGYGSIINDESRFATLHGISITNKLQSQIVYGEAGGLPEDDAVCAYLSHDYARRHWNYRCATGFTALGVNLVQREAYVHEETCNGLALEIACKHQPVKNCETVFDYDSVNGVIFSVSSEQLKSFDLREVGYYRASIPLDKIYIDLQSGCAAAKQRAARLHKKINSIKSADNSQVPTSRVNIWIYIPESTRCALPDEDFPILQTYLDVCLRGCLHWGGLTMAKHFLRTTFDWSACFLNDTPFSRRPWVSRPHFADIDACLTTFAEHVKLECRKHPEEFAAMHGSALKGGMWGLPNRNKLFIGRSNFISLMYHKLNDVVDVSSRHVIVSQELAINLQGSESVSGSISIKQVEVVGMGGVGKSQVCIEYAHRYFGTTYGFVAFIRAESTASIAADLRRLAYDIGIHHAATSVINSSLPTESDETGSVSRVRVSREAEVPLDDEAIADEIKKRLARSRFRWLLIFDNVEDPECVTHYLPRGFTSASNGGGHVLVTSRIAHDAWIARDSAMMLNCFDTMESVRFLNMALKARSGSVGTDEENKSGAGNSSVTAASHCALTSDRELEMLATRMGHLPLALWTAGVYMSKCDISSAEYIRRFDTIVTQSMHSGQSSSDAIAACFTMTLDKIASECKGSAQVLVCLGYLAPDISKRMVKLLMCAQAVADTNHDKDAASRNHAVGSKSSGQTISKDIFISGAPTILASCERGMHSSFTLPGGDSELDYLVCALLVCGVAICLQAKSIFSLPNFTRHDIAVLLFGVSVGCAVTLILVITYLRAASNMKTDLHPSDNQTSTENGRSVGMREHNAISIKAASQMAIDTSLVLLPTSLADCSGLLACHRMSCNVDQLWDVMRQFSLLSSVRGPFDDNRVGTVHRLQQAVLRSRTQKDSKYAVDSMERCVWLLYVLWNFDATDAHSWDIAGDVLEHVQILSKHVLDYMYGAVGDTHSEKLSRGRALQLASLLTSGGEYASIALSRFDIAQSLLEMACVTLVYTLNPENIRDRNKLISFDDISTAAVAKIVCIEDRMKSLENIGDTLHMLGKTLRYNGQLTQAEKCLKKALRVRKSSVESSACENALAGTTTREGFCVEDPLLSIKVSETLYELGVLYLRMHLLYTATSYFTSSLEIIGKQNLAKPSSSSVYGHKDSCNNSQRARSCTAASLHQLGVVATLEKRYEDARVQLLAALEVMTPQHAEHTASGEKTGKGRVSITQAATLQQLGKVELRCGNFVKAHSHLSSALGIYKQAYGEQRCASHVNVAAVYHHLGSTAMASKQFEQASEYFSDALTAREKITEESSRGVLEVIQAVQSLARAELECGRIDAAEELFQRAKCSLEKEIASRQELEEALQNEPDSPVKQSITTSSTLDSNSVELSNDENYAVYEVLVKNIFFCAHSLRGIYSRKDRPDLAAQMSREVRCLKAIYKEKNIMKRCKPRIKKSNPHNVPIVDNEKSPYYSDSGTVLITTEVDAPVRVCCNVVLEKPVTILLSDLLCTRHVVRTQSRCIQNTLKSCKIFNKFTVESTQLMQEACCAIAKILQHFTTKYAPPANNGHRDISLSNRLLQVSCAFTTSVERTMKTMETQLLALTETPNDIESTHLDTEQILPALSACCKDFYGAADRVRADLKALEIRVDDVT